MPLEPYYEFDIPYVELIAAIQAGWNSPETVRIRIPQKYQKNLIVPEKRPLQLFDDELLLYGETVTLPHKRYEFLRSFVKKDTVQEAVIAQNLYHSDRAEHCKIKRIADELEKALAEKVTFDYDHGYWTIHFNQL